MLHRNAFPDGNNSAGFAECLPGCSDERVNRQSLIQQIRQDGLPAPPCLDLKGTVLVQDGRVSDPLSGWLTLADVPYSGRSLLELDQDEIDVSRSPSF